MYECSISFIWQNEKETEEFNLMIEEENSSLSWREKKGSVGGYNPVHNVENYIF